MPSPHRIAELQADNFAEDLELPPDVAGWSEASVVAFLESGGVTTTAASAASFDATTAVSAESAATAAPPPVTALESGVVHISAEGGAAPLGRRARVACLHGSAGNGRIFKIQTSRLLAALQAAGADCTRARGREGARVVDADNAAAATMRRFFGDDAVLREYAPPLLDEAGRRLGEAY